MRDTSQLLFLTFLRSKLFIGRGFNFNRDRKISKKFQEDDGIDRSKSKDPPSVLID